MAAVLLIPFLSLRFGVLSMLDSSALRRAAHFPPFRGPEKPAYWLYQFSSAALLLGPFFASVHTAPGPLGERRAPQGCLPHLPQSHVCLLFFVFLGCVLLTQSLPLLAALLVFQLTAHTVIRAEERWCRQTFGAAYERYCGSVRRYL